MKSLLPLMCALLVSAGAAGRADAASAYANRYVGFWYQYGSLVGGVNVSVDDSGNVTGRGTYLDFTEINLAGTVSDSGALSLIEADGDGHRSTFDFAAQFNPSGKKFVAHTDDGYVLRVKRVAAGLPEAGTYYLHDDAREEGVVFINRAGLLYGVIYGRDGYPYELDGTADSAGFDVTSEDDVDYNASFDGDDFFGQYDDGYDFYGDFEGSKY